MKPKGERERHSTPQWREIALAGEILRTQVGSGLHGIAIPDQDDRDEMGITIEDPWQVIGPGTFEQYIQRDQPEHVRSGPGDLDLTIYSLRKWMRLALAGHPTVILPLFAPGEDVVAIHPLGRTLRGMAPAIISRQAGDRFLGYMNKQREKLETSDRGRKSNRPELIEKYGFDVKYAAHMIRIAVQGAELMRTGRITLPMTEWRSWLMNLRMGGVGKQSALIIARTVEDDLRKAISESELPDVPDADACWGWVISAYRSVWFNGLEWAT